MPCPRAARGSAATVRRKARDAVARDVRALVAALEAAIGPPEEGLPEDVLLFVSRVSPLVNVDLLIKDEQRRTLLTGQCWQSSDASPLSRWEG